MGNIGLDGSIILKLISELVGCENVDWIQLASDWVQWLVLWTRYWTSGYHKRQGMSCLPEQLSDSEEIFYSLEL